VRQQGEAATVPEIPYWVMQSGGAFRQKILQRVNKAKI
jgi:hypothetical protein